MNPVDQTALAGFLERFYYCNDGVLRELDIDLGSDGRIPTATVEMSVRDREAAEVDEGWVNLRITLDHLQEFRLVKGEKEDCKVLSNGLHIAVLMGHLFIDFGSFTDEQSTLDEYRSSSFYFSGSSIKYEVVAYRR
jgi:hypothetical protein